MAGNTFIATAWKNSRHSKTGAGYGLKISVEDRDQAFDRSWRDAVLTLPDGRGKTTVNVAKKSFWDGTCRELISADIGRWLLDAGHAPWPKGKPPRFIITPIKENRFRVIGTKR